MENLQFKHTAFTNPPACVSAWYTKDKDSI